MRPHNPPAHNSRTPHRFRPSHSSILLRRLQRILLLLQPVQHPPPILGQLRPAILLDGRGEEPRLPLLAALLALGGALALPLLEFGFPGGGLVVLLGEDGLGDAVPEGAGFVGELGVGGRAFLRDGEERDDVDEDEFVRGGDLFGFGRAEGVVQLLGPGAFDPDDRGSASIRDWELVQ